MPLPHSIQWVEPRQCKVWVRDSLCSWYDTPHSIQGHTCLPKVEASTIIIHASVAPEKTDLHFISQCDQPLLPLAPDTNTMAFNAAFRIFSLPMNRVDTQTPRPPSYNTNDCLGGTEGKPESEDVGPATEDSNNCNNEYEIFTRMLRISMASQAS